MSSLNQKSGPSVIHTYIHSFIKHVSIYLHGHPKEERVNRNHSRQQKTMAHEYLIMSTHHILFIHANLDYGITR